MSIHSCSRENRDANEDIKLVGGGLAANNIMKKYNTEKVSQQEESLIVQLKPLSVCMVQMVASIDITPESSLGRKLSLARQSSDSILLKPVY